MSGLISIKKNIDFRRIYKRGKCGVTPTLVVYVLRNRRLDRLGITAGKKVGCAAKRNRAKRRIRALYREQILSGALPEGGEKLDMIVVARAAAVDADFDRLRRDFKTAVGKAAAQLQNKH